LDIDYSLAPSSLFGLSENSEDSTMINIVVALCRATCYIHSMIISFKHKGLKHLYEHDDGSKLPAALLARISLILSVLDSADCPEDMNRPSFHLHPLKGDRQGQWAITVRANWRIIFVFNGRDIIDVDFIDYH